MRRTVCLLLGTVSSILLLFLIFRKVDLRETASTLTMIRYIYLGPAVVTLLLTFVVKAFRWRVLLEPVDRMPVRSLFPAIMIGYFSNYFLPVNSGELVRAFVLGHSPTVSWGGPRHRADAPARQEKSLSNSTILGTILVERMLDVLILTGFLLVAFIVWPLPGWVRSMALFVAVALAGGWCFLWLVLWQRGRADRVVGFILERTTSPLARRVVQVSNRFLDGLKTLRSNRAMAWATLLTLLLWSFSAVTFYLVGQSLGIALPLAAYCVPVAIVNLGAAIPALPGRVGALEALYVSSLALFAVESDVGLAFDVVMRVLYLAPIVWGWFHLYRTGFHLLDIRAHDWPEEAH
jgi:uncharacterized protein (TIRG00374 family)